MSSRDPVGSRPGRKEQPPERSVIMDDGPEIEREIEIPVPGAGGRRRFTLEQKRALLEEAKKPGASISEVARRYRIAPSMLFTWRKALREAEANNHSAMPGANAPASHKSTTKDRVSLSEELRRRDSHIAELERALGRKTMEVEILQEALRSAGEQNLMSPIAIVDVLKKLGSG